ncbi:MAG: arsenosugar biosynthesis-associated peroxidase-like protein [Planctomycetota bacterium]|nr:arsenosugar biosynthesis-associated peroxidase-like protein [Planctomycetota bacterium]
MESYYDPDDLARFGEVGDHKPELYEAFNRWYSDTMAEGALPKKTKALIAMAVAHAVQCPYCIDAWAVGARNAGSSMDEITEALHVASAIRGGAALVHGVQAINAMERD